MTKLNGIARRASLTLLLALFPLLLLAPMASAYYASAREILMAGASNGNGVYTIDPNQTGTGFQIYADMTTLGGGWTLGDNRLSGTDPLTLTQNTGTFGTNAAYSYDLTSFHLANTGNQFMVDILNTSHSEIFKGTYTGSYSAFLSALSAPDLSGWLVMSNPGGLSSIASYHDGNFGDYSVYIREAQAPSPVPIPAALSLLAPGLLGLAGARRRLGKYMSL